MEKIENWENIEAKGINDFQRLNAGGYVGIIKNVNQHTSLTDKKSFKIECDIAEGNFKDYFQKLFDNNSNADKRWDNNSTKYVSIEEDQLPYFKGFITCIENSNPGYTWDWDEKKLIGKKIGLIYRYEEYEKQDGTKAIKTKLNQFRSVDKVNEFNDDYTKVESVKLLNGSYMSCDDYYERQEMKESSDSVEIVLDNDSLPF